MTRLRDALFAALLVACLSLAAVPAAQAAGQVVLVSSPEVTDLDGVGAQGLIPSISVGGRYVGLIADDSARGTFVLLRDMQRPGAIAVTKPGESEEGGFDADSPGLSSDGRYLVFGSEDPGLSSEDVNFSRGPLGEPTGNPVRDVFVYDRVNKSITLASRRSGATGAAANENSNLPAISGDGRYVAFGTESNNLTPGQHFEGGVYVRDLRKKTTTLASRQSGAKGAPIGGFEPSLSENGNEVAFSWSFGHGFHDRNNEISVRDQKRRRTVLVSRASGAAGAIANADCEEAAIAADGRYVAFASQATNLVGGDDHQVEDVFVRDLKTDRTMLVSRASGRQGQPGSGDSSRPAISANGRYIAFQSYASNLGPHDNAAVPDVFVRDMKTGRVDLASAGIGGAPANGPSADPGISPDGHFVVFDSKATNLSPEDTNRQMSVFRYQIQP